MNQGDVWAASLIYG